MAEHFDARETADPEQREGELFARLGPALARAKKAQPLWRERLADIDPSEIETRTALATLPVLRKSDLIELQKADPPFGGMNAVAPGVLARLYVSPGPIFDPEGAGEDWWGAARALHAAGLRSGAVVLNTFSYHLTPAAAIFESGARALGCAVIPAGPGNVESQLTAIAQFRPSAYAGTADFLKILLDAAAERGVDATSIRRAAVSGAAFPKALRDDFAARGVAARECYGTADLGIVAYEGEGPGMVVNEDILVEIVHPGTGAPLPPGEVGEVVVTRLVPEYPLIRFATGDLSRVLTGPSPDGRTNMRIAGWMGRADQATKVKGMFVRPEQMAVLGRALPGLGRLRLRVGRESDRDVMTLQAEHADPAAEAALSAELAEVTKLTGRVEIVPPGTLPNDGKVIVDERPQEG